MRALLFLALSTAPAVAQEAQLSDVEPVRTCLEAGGGRNCVGKAAEACMKSGGGKTTLGMNQCLAAERDFWDARLNDIYGTAMASLPPDRAEALREMQRRWIPYRDAACAYDAAGYDSGSLAGTVHVQCQMELTAQQALRIEASMAEGG